MDKNKGNDGLAFSLSGQYLENKQYIDSLNKAYDNIIDKVRYYGGRATDVVKYELPAGIATFSGLVLGVGALEASDAGSFSEIAKLYTHTPFGAVALGLTTLGAVGFGISALAKKYYDSKVESGIQEATELAETIDQEDRNQEMLLDTIFENTSDVEFISKTLGLKTEQESKLEVEQSLENMMKVADSISLTSPDASSQEPTE